MNDSARAIETETVVGENTNNGGLDRSKKENRSF